MALILLFGGKSEERRVSVASAQNVAFTLPEAQPWYLSPTGEIFACSRTTLLEHARPFETDFDPKMACTFATFEEALEKEKQNSPTFFLGLHGGEGEDGTLQAELERLKLPFTGSGSEASRRAFHKQNTKLVAKANGIRIAPSAELKSTNLGVIDRTLSGLFLEHGELIAKPMASGSSVGLFRLKTQADISKVAVALAGLHGQEYLVEKFVTGRELTVGVYEDGHTLQALPPSEVRLAAGREFDFEGKYLGKGTEEITPAQLTPQETADAQAMALVIHRALGCQGYSRTDMILTTDGPIFLETNTLPGLTKASFIPQQLAAAKLPLETFLRGQIALAESRYSPRRAHLRIPQLSSASSSRG